jgi:hypothetical protein
MARREEEEEDGVPGIGSLAGREGAWEEEVVVVVVCVRVCVRGCIMGLGMSKNANE